MLDDSQLADEGLLMEMGIGQEAYRELMTVVGHLPTVDEVSTLMAMWKQQGGRQSLLSWLRGQQHSVVQHDYLCDDREPEGCSYREPEVRECIEIARQLFVDNKVSRSAVGESFAHRGDAIYMIGDVSSMFTGSEYSRRYLHLVEHPIAMDDAETESYLELILSSMHSNGLLSGYRRIGKWGLFGALMAVVAPGRVGFDILTCREVRLDAFLFGEKGVRFLAVLDEPREDFFLQKLSEARVNCCFLGRVTADRIVIDGVDFGRSAAYTTK